MKCVLGWHFKGRVQKPTTFVSKWILGKGQKNRSFCLLLRAEESLDSPITEWHKHLRATLGYSDKVQPSFLSFFFHLSKITIQLHFFVNNRY